MIELTGKTFCIFGLKGTGKTVLLNHIAASFKSKALLYDTLHEIKNADKLPYDVYQPNHRYSETELSDVIRSVIKSRNYRFIGIDEMNRFAHPHPTRLSDAIVDLNDMSRHYDLTVGYIARRPVQLHCDLIELSAYLFIFNLKGRNDILALNDLSAGLGDAVVSLQPYHFISVAPDRSYSLFSPISYKS